MTAAPISSFKKFLKKQAPVTIIPLAHKKSKLKGESASVANSGNVDMSNGGLTDAMTENGPDKNSQGMQEGQVCAYDKDGKLVGNYKDLKTAKLLKPGHTYKANNAGEEGYNPDNQSYAEQLDEVSAGKLGQYIKKSSDDERQRRGDAIEWRDRIRKQMGIKVGTPLDRKLYSPTASRKAGQDLAYSKLTGKARVNASEEVQLDELAKTPMNSTKTEDLHSRLSKYYNIDAKDKEAVGIFHKFHNHINNSLAKGSKGPEEKSKPDPVDAEAEKTQADAMAAGKKIDQLLAAHKAPTADFHVYAGLKHHPFETIKDEQGYEAGEEPVEAHIPTFAQASIDPNYARNNAGKGGHVLKMQIKAGSKHGAYIGGIEGNDSREFLLRPGRKLRIHPQPEMHGDTHIWHGELSGDK